MARNRRPGGLIAGLAVLALLGGCSPTAISFQEFHTSYCSAWESMFRAVGNPDIGDGSVLTDEMDAAITSGDIASVDRVAAEITSELETGRKQIAMATGWGPAAPLMAQLDRVFVGFEKMTEAKRAAAGQGLDVARGIRQETLEQSGAIDAWFALIRPGVLDETRRAIQAARPADVPVECPNVPTGI
jgi:hypothetical protein